MRRIDPSLARELRARGIIIATGSQPVVPAPWRALGERLLTSDTLFEQESLPARMVVIGLGAMGVEIRRRCPGSVWMSPDSTACTRSRA